MPKAIPAGALAAIQQQYVQVRALLEIGTATPMRFCWGDRPIEYSANTYEPRHFKFNKLVQGQIHRAGVAVVVDNRDNAISDSLYAGTPEYLTGLQMAIVILVRNAEGDDWENYAPMTGEIGDNTFSNQSVALRISGQTGFRHSGGPKVGSKHCRHKIYKGTRCKYAGAELTCDRRRATCVARGNAANFGGWFWAPEPGQVIQIGRPLEIQSHPTGGGGFYSSDTPFDLLPQHPIALAGFAHAWQITDAISTEIISAELAGGGES